jgi:hypothetical protein
MALKKQQPQHELPEEGTVPARLARIIEIGEHKQGIYGIKNLVHLFLSLPTRIIAGEGEYKGKQHMIRTPPLNYSANEASNLMQDYISVISPSLHQEILDAEDESELDVSPLLNGPLFVTIQHNDKYANVVNTSPVPEGMVVGELDTTPFIFEFDNPDPDIWTKYLWDGIRNRIKKAVNYPGSAVEEMVLRLEAMKE